MNKIVLAVSPARHKDFKNYLSWLNYHDIEYVVLSKELTIPEQCTALLLTGGEDYGLNKTRDFLELQWFNDAVSKKLHIFGICRGLQVINVFCGGTLVQDIDSDCLSRNANKHCSIAVKNSEIKKSSFHEVRNGRVSFKVNSRHHQCIDVVGSNLIAEFYNNDVIESVYSSKRNLNIFAVQWHPEREEVRWTKCEQAFIEELYNAHNIKYEHLNSFKLLIMRLLYKFFKL